MAKSQNSLTIYLQQIGRYPLLTPEQELELGRRIKEENDPIAREELANSNLRLVVSVAKAFKNQNTSMDDLIAEGNLGLMTAVDKYDYTLGYRFSTCAVPWIKQAISKSIIDKSRQIRIPAHIVQLFNKHRTALDELSAQGICNPTDAQVAKQMGVDEDQIRDIMMWKQNTISITTPLGDEEGNTLEDMCADGESETPVEYTERMMRHDIVVEMIHTLDSRTQAIFKLRYGLGEEGDPAEYFQEHTLEEIGDLLEPKITRERVRQIIEKTIQKLHITYGAKYGA